MRLKGKAAAVHDFHHQCHKDCWFCILAKMAGLQEQTLPSSSALPQVRRTMELMGHGQWQRGNMNSCFMSCTMLSHAGAEFSLEQGQQQIFIWQMLSPAILESTLYLCRAAAEGSSGPASGHSTLAIAQSSVKQ